MTSDSDNNMDLTPNFLQTVDITDPKNKSNDVVSSKDLLAAQALSLCDTDQIMDELLSRMYPDQSPAITALDSFKVNMLLTELSYRAQKIALVLIEAQSAIAMSELLLSAGSLFKTDRAVLDGYTPVTGSKDDYK